MARMKHYNLLSGINVHKTNAPEETMSLIQRLILEILEWTKTSLYTSSGSLVVRDSVWVSTSRQT